MPICKPSELKQMIAPRQRILGFDLGEKTIGLAISDATFMIASPLEILPKGKFSKDVKKIEQIVADREVGGFVIGLPINMDGTEGPRCDSVRDFGRNLLGFIDLPLTFWDERMSTVAVEKAMLEADMTRKRRKEKVDKLAASYILQGLLDAN